MFEMKYGKIVYASTILSSEELKGIYRYPE